MTGPRPGDETAPVTVEAEDQGGDPACWVHLFAGEAGEPDEAPARRPCE